MIDIGVHRRGTRTRIMSALTTPAGYADPVPFMTAFYQASVAGETAFYQASVAGEAQLEGGDPRWDSSGWPVPLSRAQAYAATKQDLIDRRIDEGVLELSRTRYALPPHFMRLGSGRDEPLGKPEPRPLDFHRSSACWSRTRQLISKPHGRAVAALASRISVVKRYYVLPARIS